MPKEKSTGAVIFRREADKIFFLVVHYHFKGDYWDLIRGKVEQGETEEQTAKREIKEETGIEVDHFIEGFRETANWFYRWENQDIFKEAVYFLVGTEKKEIDLSNEHVEYEWLEYEGALERLTYENSRDVVRKANKLIKSLYE